MERGVYSAQNPNTIPIPIVCTLHYTVHIFLSHYFPLNEQGIGIRNWEGEGCSPHTAYLVYVYSPLTHTSHSAVLYYVFITTYSASFPFFFIIIKININYKLTTSRTHLLLLVPDWSLVFISLRPLYNKLPSFYFEFEVWTLCNFIGLITRVG